MRNRQVGQIVLLLRWDEILPRKPILHRKSDLVFPRRRKRRADDTPRIMPNLGPDIEVAIGDGSRNPFSKSSGPLHNFER
jgi:hypothetical protein